jgi:peroxiredoxin
MNHAATPQGSPAAEPPRNVELWAGLGLMGVLALCLGLGAVDVWQRRAELRPLLPGDAAPAFALPGVNRDGRLGLDSFKGQVVLMDFWATWCPPCLREMPELAALHTDLSARGFTVLGVNREPEDPAKVKAFVAERGIPFPVVMDNEDVGARYRLVSLPMTVLVGRDGNVVQQFMGYTEPAVMRAAVENALGH